MEFSNRAAQIQLRNPGRFDSRGQASEIPVSGRLGVLSVVPECFGAGDHRETHFQSDHRWKVPITFRMGLPYSPP